MIIYSDESGDLGWKFDAPYRNGGSSRYLTIASLIITPDKKHLSKRLIAELYKKWPVHDVEKKWARMNPDERIWFVQKANELQVNHPNDIRYLSITVKKENVQMHIRSDANKLYNYMIGLSLLDEMSKHPSVVFIPDPRSIKVASGNSLHDYLQTRLWFEYGVKTRLETKLNDSTKSKNIQFSDMLSGVIQSHFEDGNSEPREKLGNSINCKTLFFN